MSSAMPSVVASEAADAGEAPKRPALSLKLDALSAMPPADPGYFGLLLDLMIGLADARAGVIARIGRSGCEPHVMATAGGAQLVDPLEASRAATVGHAHLVQGSGDQGRRIAVPLAAFEGDMAVAMLDPGAERAPFALALALERLELLAAVHRANLKDGGALPEMAVVQCLARRGAPAVRTQGFADAAMEYLGAAALAVGRVNGGRVSRVAFARHAAVAGTSAMASAVRAAIGRRLDEAAPPHGVQQLAGRVEDAWIVSLIHDGSRTVGAIAFTPPADAVSRDLLVRRAGRLAEVAGPWFAAGARGQTINERWAEIAADPRRKAAIVVCLIVGASLLAVPLPDRVATPFRLEALENRTVTAPFDGQLEVVHVKPNDRVAAGATVLAKLATRELDMILASHEASRASALAERAIAQQAQKPSEARAAELKVQKADAEIAITKFRKSLAEIKSPIDGTVVKADVQRQAGSVVSRGQVLFEVADPRALEVDLLVPDEDIARIAAGQTGVLSPAAEPGASYAFRVERIHPVSEQVGSRTVFRVRATLEGERPARLKTGMEGAARVHTGWAPAGWLMVRDIVYTVRRWLWV